MALLFWMILNQPDFIRKLSLMSADMCSCTSWLYVKARSGHIHFEIIFTIKPHKLYVCAVY